MNKMEFLAAVRSHIGALPNHDINRALDFLAEMIDDKIEDGMSEEEAVAAMGSPEEAAGEILPVTPPPTLVKPKVKPRHELKTRHIVLLVLGIPVWAPLVIAAASVILSAYIVIWSAVIVLFSAFASLCAGALAGILCTIVSGVFFSRPHTLFFCGAALICAGCAVLMFHLARITAKGTIWLGRLICRAVRSLFVNRGANA